MDNFSILFQEMSQRGPIVAILGLVVVPAFLIMLYGLRRARPTGSAPGPRPEPAAKSLVPLRQTSPPKPIVAAAASPARKAAILDDRAQIDRLFGYVGDSVKSGERAIAAHGQAARHLDSAEYQLQHLFAEFPVITRATSTAPVCDLPGL